MKTFYLVAIFCLAAITYSQAQEKTYIPNARQAVQKSRMQQPQYIEVSNNAIPSEQVRLISTASNQLEVKATTASSESPYQPERNLNTDAPKRRGNKSSNSTLSKLASNTKF